jgi:hypothetical protein
MRQPNFDCQIQLATFDEKSNKFFKKICVCCCMGLGCVVYLNTKEVIDHAVREAVDSAFRRLGLDSIDRWDYFSDQVADEVIEELQAIIDMRDTPLFWNEKQQGKN